MSAVYVGFCMLLLGAILLVMVSNYYYASGVSSIKKKTHAILFGICVPLVSVGIAGFAVAGLVAYAASERTVRKSSKTGQADEGVVPK